MRKGDNDSDIADLGRAMQLDPKIAATSFDNRGNAYRAKGDFDRAIADYGEAIQADAKYARAFSSRSFAYSVKGDYDRAIADYNEAIRLDPKAASRNRGLVFFYSGDFEKAVAALLLANDLKDDAYTMLWRYLEREHMYQDGAAELSDDATRVKTTNWPYAVIDFYLGRRSLDEMRAAAANANEQCELAFFAGEWQLLGGNKAEARASLQVAVDTCPKNFAE
jgi:lipoprotein NlpI